MRPFLLYHWSPRKARESILKYGLCPGKRSLLLDEWRAPYVCFARFPTVAYALSVTHARIPGPWDLWCCWSDVAPYKTVNGTGKWYTTEYRIARRIKKKDVFHIGTKWFRLRRKSHGPSCCRRRNK